LYRLLRGLLESKVFILNLHKINNTLEKIYGKPPVGCVAVATAQIMKYYQYPNSYNWSIMPNNPGSLETARLMKEIGERLGVKYDCDASSAKTENVC
jgi:hypothetical protein